MVLMSTEKKRAYIPNAQQQQGFIIDILKANCQSISKANVCICQSVDR